MNLQLSEQDADLCRNACIQFSSSIRDRRMQSFRFLQNREAENYRSAQLINNSYSLLVNDDRFLLLSDFASQAEAMGALFGIAGGILAAEDDKVARILAAAASEPPVIKSPGAFGLKNSMIDFLLPKDSAKPTPSFADVGREEPSTLSDDKLFGGGKALDPNSYLDAAQALRESGTALEEASTTLRDSLHRILGSEWQGQFADHALESVRAFDASAFALATDFKTAADGAEQMHHGFSAAKSTIEAQAAKSADNADDPNFLTRAARLLTPKDEAGIAAEARAAARRDAERAVATDYNTGLAAGDPSRFAFTTAYRPVASLPAENGGLTHGWNTSGSPPALAAIAPSDQDPTQALSGNGHQTDGAGDAAGAVAAAGHGAGTASGAEPGSATDTRQVDAATRNAIADPAQSGSSPVPGAQRDTDSGGRPSSPVNAMTTPSAVTPIGALGGSPRAGVGDRSTSGDRSGTADSVGGPTGSGAGAASARDRRRQSYDSAATGLGGGAALGGAGTLAGAGAAGALGRAGTPSGANISGLGGGSTTGSGSAPHGAFAGTPGSASRGAATGSALPGVGPAAGASTRGGSGMTGMAMAPGIAGQNGDRREGHRPASYLVHATNTTELIGDLPRVSPAVLGAPDAGERGPDANRDPRSGG